MNTSAAALLNADYISGAVSESLRLATASFPAVQRVPVRPFAKPNYRDGQGESTDRICGARGCLAQYPRPFNSSGVCAARPPRASMSRDMCLPSVPDVHAAAC
jgi:hypothetical protein